MAVNFQKLPHAGIQSLIPYKPGKSIEEVAREKKITNIIKMASNENPLGCSPLALAALRNISSNVLATYPSPLNHPLMNKLSQKLNLQPDQIFLSNGSDYIVSILLNSFALHNEKHILVHDYAFSTYAIQANAFNIPVYSVSINPDWTVNINNLIKACNPKTGIIFLANPNNPTGKLINLDDLKLLLKNIPQSTLLVIDEAYYEFATTEQPLNTIEWLGKYPNLILTRTFSKIYGLAGLRLGYALAHPSIIDILQRVQLPFTVNQAALTAAYAALDDHEFINLSLQTNKAGMQQIQAGFNKLNIKYLTSICNFLTFDCNEDSSSLYHYLLDKGIIVRPLHPYKMNNYIRVTIGTETQNKRFLNALNNYYHQ